MPDITLTEREVQTFLRCLNDRVEPPEALAKKLFPKLYAGFDFKTLNRASIPTIEYAGKRSEAAILNEASAFGAGSPLQIVRFFRGGKFQKDVQQPDRGPVGAETTCCGSATFIQIARLPSGPAGRCFGTNVPLL